MNKKSFSSVLVVTLALIIILGFAGYFILFQKQKTITTTLITPISDTSALLNKQLSNNFMLETPSLSTNKKNIILDNKVLLSINSEIIFNWFKNKSQLCDSYSLSNISKRKIFCENKKYFNDQVSFNSIVVSPDKMKIGFTIESNLLSPDKVVGIFLRSSGKVNLFTNYYLGNKFIGFSPNSKYFVYRSNCWEGLCGLFVKDSQTLIEKASLNNPEYLDYRTTDTKFIRWISNDKIEYKIGIELKQKSF